MTPTTNRETWLNDMAALMAPRFEELGYPLPPFRCAVGFTSAGKTSKVGGECWHKSRSADARFEILVSPILDDSMDVAGTLAHELTHAAVGFEHKHKGAFATVVLALGLQRPLTATTPGPAFKEWAAPFIEQLGPIPHAKLSWNEVQSPAPGGEDGEAEEGPGAGSSNAKPKQSTRMLKACCSHQVVIGENGLECEPKPCGYTVRLSKKWALQLGAACPVHGSMEIDGLDDANDGEEDGEA